MNKKSLLWQIDHPDFTGSCYLFGTMHVQDQRAFRFVEPVLEVMDSCAVFATEFNLDEATQGISPNYLRLPGQQSYHDFLTAKQIGKLQKVVQQQVNLDIQPYLTMKPLVLIQLITAFLLQKDEQYSLDEYLFRQARQRGISCVGLETYAEQLEILNQLPLENQFKSLVAISKNFKRFRKQLLKTTTAYESADVQQIFKAAKKSAQGMRKILLYNRNALMTERFLNLARENSLLAAVGAGHLGGKKGVLRQLKMANCRIFPV